jgi:hypothetical protein
MSQLKGSRFELYHHLEQIAKKMNNISTIAQRNQKEVGEVSYDYPFEGSLEDTAYDLEQWELEIKKAVTKNG